MRTWPIAVSRGTGRTFVGIPDRLGDGRSFRDPAAPSLEEVAGEEWSSELLGVLLPEDRAWAWWTTTRVLRQALPSAVRGPAVVAVDALDVPCFRSRPWWRGMALALVPPAAGAQREIRRWAGQDSELAEHLWTASPGASRWDTSAIAAWCRSRERWSDPTSVAAQPAERILVVFDGCLFCALPPDAAGGTLAALEALAGRWRLSLTEARPEHAWITPPP